MNPPPGCAFHPRCPFAVAACRQEVPALEVKKVKLRAKFEDLVTPVLGDRKTEELRGAILSLDTLEDIGVLFDA